MPGVRGAENLRITGTPQGDRPPYYRISLLIYDNLDGLHAGLASGDGAAVLADLANFATGGATVLIAEE